MKKHNKMIAKDILPCEALAAYVKHYRLRHFVFTNNITPPAKPFPPRPEQTLTFFVRGDETVHYINQRVKLKKSRSVLSGQFTERADRYISYPETLMIIVDFLPGALYRLMNIPFIEFTNRDMDAEDVLPAAFRKINERLANATSYESMITVIENFLLSLLKRSKNEYRPIDHILATITEDPDHSMEWMIHNGFLSLRQLERKFNERVGVNPKTFLRIARFHQSYLMYLKRTSLNWFQIAMNCGYTDYQHLVRDYKQFTNTTPNQFFMQERNSPGRVLGLTNYPR